MEVHGTASYLQVADSKSAIPNDKVFAAWFPRMPKDNTEIQVKTAEGKIFTIDPARIVVALSCAGRTALLARSVFPFPLLLVGVVWAASTRANIMTSSSSV